jgi:hypothetical protein
MPLVDTTTQKIILRKGEAAKQQSELAERSLLKSTLLKEELVPFPGDEAAFHLCWLANAPFMQTRVGSDVYKDKDIRHTEEAMAGTHLPQIADSIAVTDHSYLDAASQRKPKALALHVSLSDKTYISGLYHQKTSLKIDVFFNGILSACWSMPSYDVRSGMKGYYRVFAGTRIDFLAERPWIVLPPGLTADGSAGKNNTQPSVEQRWQHLCHALQAEARERGTDEEGNVPPTAEFLRALATMQMPEQVRGMQKPGGKTFGVIDVVITAGEGRKLTSGVGYLKAPKRMIDESYPFVLGDNGTTIQMRSDAPGKSESDGELQDTVEPSSEIIDVDAGGDSDPDYGSNTKRQALQSRVQSKWHISSALPSGPQHPTMEPPMPSIPPPVAVGSRIPLLVAHNTTGPTLASSPVRRNVNLDNTTSSLEHGPALAQDKVYRQEADIMSRTDVIPKTMYPGFPPSLQTPQMHLSPYTVQFSDPTLGGIAPSDLMRQIAVDNAGPTYSPLDRFPISFQGPGYQHSSSLSTQISGLKHPPSRFIPYVYSPDQARGSSSNTHHPRQNHIPSGVGPYLPREPESYKSNMLPQASAGFGSHETRPQLAPFPPFDHRLSLPLPPTALYSVPTKPKRSLSPQKACSSKKPQKAKPNLLVRRLVVHGQDKSILVDHRWESAQRIPLPFSSTVEPETQETLVRDASEQVGSGEREETSTGLSASRKSTVRMDTPPPTSPLAQGKIEESTASNGQQRASERQMDIATGQRTSTAKDFAPMQEPEKSDQAKLDADQPRANLSSQSLHVVKQRPSRRTASSHDILGVQGSKANPFWFEDPEEILREASARLRRSRSFAKKGDTSDAAPLPKTTVPNGQDFKAWETATLSPLSNLHTTPEPEMEFTSYNRSPQAPIESSPAPIPQEDGSPEHKVLPKARRVNQTPSPIKLASTLTTPQLAHHDPSAPQSSATKKRKCLHRTLPKEPRSPTRLKTNDNPPLNRNCVIAYAESKDKKSKHGILRQVKSERLGVFKENDVVFAARFFVEE